MNLKSILIVACLVIGGAAVAQTGGAKSGGAKQGSGRVGGPAGQGGQFRMRSPEDRVERLAKQINLTADQKKKILALYKANAPKQKALMDDKKMTREQKMAAFGKMRDENNKKMAAILTKDQMKKLQDMRRQGGQRGPGGPPPTGGKAGGTKSGGTKSGGRG